MPSEHPLDTADGTMWSYVATPKRPADTAVVVLMEAFGVNDHIRDVCDRFAEAGHLAVAPDLYHRVGRFVTGAYDDHASVMGHFASLTTGGMADDIRRTMSALSDDHGIDAGATAVVGFCLGGYGAVLAAVEETPAVVAGFYGAGLSIRREGSPLDPLAPAFDRIGCPVLLLYGEDDPVIPAEEIERTRLALDDAGVDAQIQVYPGAGHGFFCDARASYVPAAAADAWRRVLEALDGSLGRSS